MALIDEDHDVQALRTPEGFNWSLLGTSDTALIVAWAQKEQGAQGGPPPEDALRSSVFAGVWAVDHLSVRAQAGWKKYVLFFTGLNAAIWDDAYPTDAGIFVEWALAAIERHGWGPDGNASPLGQLHSMCMSKWRMRRDASGRYLPPDGTDASTAAAVEIVAALAEHARGRYSGEIDPFSAWPIDKMLRDLPAREADDFIRSFAHPAVAIDGWGLYGAAAAVMSARSDLDEIPSYRLLMEASLRSRRARNFWESDLSVKEQMLWMSLNGGDRTWLPVRVPPSESAHRITPMAVGDERVIAVLSPWSDSNLVVATRRGESEYVAINDMAVERDNPGRGRDRRENDSAPTLYQLYARVGPQIPSPPHRVDPEFEPFLRHPLPVLP